MILMSISYAVLIFCVFYGSWYAKKIRKYYPNEHLIELIKKGMNKESKMILNKSIKIIIFGFIQCILIALSIAFYNINIS